MERLDSYFKAYNKINEEVDYQLEEINPKQLLNSRRIDLVVKYYYIKARETGENLAFAQELYGKHLEAFSDGTFEEQGNPEKDSLGKYFEVFDALIDDFKKGGFDATRSVLPVGGHGEILDGSHRTACALYFESPVTIIRFPAITVDYGFDFFRKRLLDDYYLDFIAKEYVMLKEQVDTLLVWPKAGKNKNIKYIEAALKRHNFEVIYQKKFAVSQAVLEDLVYHLYREEPWVGFSRENFQNIKNKADLCYDADGYLMIYLLEGSDLQKLTDFKEKLRAHFQMEKSSVHTTDSHQETVDLVNFLFDKDYEQLLHQNFLNRKEIDHTFTRVLHRKLRYHYRRGLNKIKKILKKPV